jgi:hypothetical protein
MASADLQSISISRNLRVLRKFLALPMNLKMRSLIIRHLRTLKFTGAMCAKNAGEVLLLLLLLRDCLQLVCNLSVSVGIIALLARIVRPRPRSRSRYWWNFWQGKRI